ncbi:hypothetical protein AAHA92_03349 [Salvia divinorum]|uniref:Uncharacterized protein n=1 Tax=Salvia divinorum TaxID=28513 RepID=A0ABD1IGU4_SALDI
MTADIADSPQGWLLHSQHPTLRGCVFPMQYQALPIKDCGSMNKLSSTTWEMMCEGNQASRRVVWAMPLAMFMVQPAVYVCYNFLIVQTRLVCLIEASLFLLEAYPFPGNYCHLDANVWAPRRVGFEHDLLLH